MKIQLNYCATKAVLQVYTTSEDSNECSFVGWAEIAMPTTLKVKLQIQCFTINMIFKYIYH